MSRITKIFAGLILALVTVFIIGAVFFLLFFDANDFRDDVASAVSEKTGRELLIEGDVSLAFFPWFAIEVGPTTLGNAPGFGDEPFARFDRAKLSIRLLPMLLRQEIAIDTAELEALTLNLAVDARGRNNWDDLLADKDPDKVEAQDESAAAIEISGVNVIDTTITYSDKQAGETYSFRQMTMQLGRLSDEGQPVPAKGSFLFDMQPDAISGNIELDTVLSFNLKDGVVLFDGLTVSGVIEGIATSPTRLEFETPGIEVRTKEETATVQPLEVKILGIDIKADLEPFSYAGSVLPKGKIQIDAFSPRSLMSLLDIEVPETADPVALSRVIVDANATVTTKAIELKDLNVKLDDTTFKGTVSVPRSSNGNYRFNLDADRIDLARYMEPADAAAAAAAGKDEAVPVEIPAEMIRAINARGDLRIKTASLGEMIFNNVVLGLNAANGRLRLNPLSANLFGGSYSGDVRIDASGATPVLAVNENVEDVRLADLAQAMFKKKNITGTISGGFNLTGRGNDMGAVQKSLAGNMSFKLSDGAYEGTDIWYELRRARALLKGGAAPKPTLPARTAFSSVSATGVVTDGVMRNDDLVAELPFMRLSGSGNVDLAAGSVDYSLIARVLERPDALENISEEELDDFTEAVIPLKITGPLSSPSVKPDIEKLLKKQVEKEIKDRLLDRLLG
ncbi:MAG: AsmA family protein, partial [Woeseiaceae bacterium]